MEAKIDMSEMVVYDKVSWHTSDAKSPVDVKTAKVHFQVLMDWLSRNNLLSAHGKEEYEIGIDSSFAITSRMLSDVGNDIMKNYYKIWLKSFNYGDIPSTDYLDEKLRG